MQELLVVICSSSIEEEVTEELVQAGMRYYTKIPGLHGVGKNSEPKLDSHVWPGTNTMILVVEADEKITRLIQVVKNLREKHREAGFWAFTMPVSLAL